MKQAAVFGFFLFSASVVALMFFSFPNIERDSSFPGFTLADIRDDMATITTGRKLKEMSHPSTNNKRSVGRIVNLDDYLPVDPAPSSKASIMPGPIEHDNPLIPFIPKSPPPVNPPKGSPLP